MSTPDLAWFKSSYSSGQGDNCIEVALSWRKSSYSGDSGDNCVEVAAHAASVHVRDSKDRQGPSLAFDAQEWAHFVTFARAQRQR
ncbi:DUF397 domain-containing protein [Streptomyces sp. V4-01]|uniref:DUF397 domain-containing protein n=1 Tax=Actinacidiphila polyblastidii TaxID=3110430 RepID=A0ABU7PBY9_9ACTN|nr:DUF397 domain-containing protein [Streptomyces sp. V4-01]